MLRMLFYVVSLLTLLAVAVVAKAYGTAGTLAFALLAGSLLAAVLLARRRHRPARIRDGIGFVRPRHRP